MVIGAAAALIAAATLVPVPARADDELHNITYIARIDGVAPGSVATFLTGDGQANSAPLSALPGRVFEANTVLDDPAKAGMRIQLHWPNSANVHCEITVDGTIAVQVDQFVAPQMNNTDADNGVLSCGAPLQPGDTVDAGHPPG